MKRYCIGIVCLCYVIMTLAAPFPAGAAAPDYELSVLYAQIFPAGTTAYDALAPLVTSATSDDSNDLPVLSGAAAAQPGEIVVLTVGFRNNTASAVQIGSFGAKLSYDTDKLELCNLFGHNAYEIGADFVNGWMISPNVNANNNYVNVTGFASGNANSLAANNQTVMARFAFRVKSAATDGVTQFAFDAPKSYVANGANQRFTLGDLAPFTLTVSGGSNPDPAPDPGDSTAPAPPDPGDSSTPAPTPTPTPAPNPATDYELSILNAQAFPAGTTAYDASAASITSAKPGEIVVLTVGFRNNTASAVEIGSFGAKLSYDTDMLELRNLFGYNAYEIGADFVNGWMTSPNVNANNNYVNVTGFASGNANSLAANGQSVIARFAFQVKSGAADGVTQFAFDASRSYVANAANQRFALRELAPFTLSVSAHEYAIGKLTRNGAEISAEITNQSGAGGVLMIAAYSDTGKFLRCAMENVTESQIARGSAENVAVTLDLSGAKTTRVFLLDAQTLSPLSRVCSESV